MRRRIIVGPQLTPHQVQRLKIVQDEENFFRIYFPLDELVDEDGSAICMKRDGYFPEKYIDEFEATKALRLVKKKYKKENDS